MGRALWDILYLLLFVVIYGAWNYSRHEGVYHDVLVSFKQKNAGYDESLVVSSENDQDGENNDGDESQDENTSEDSGGTQLKSSEEQKQEEAKLRATAAKERKQEALLRQLSDRFNQGFDKGVNLDSLVDSAIANSQGDEELQEKYRSEVREQVARWAKESDALNELGAMRQRGQLDESSQEYKELIARAEKQRNWVAQELKRMSLAMRKALRAQKKREEPLPEEFLRIEEVPDEPEPSLASISHDATSLESDEDVSGQQPAVQAKVESRADLVEQLREIRDSIASQGSTTNGGKVLVVGDKGYVSRDLPAYEAAFSPLGFTVHRRRMEGAMTSKTLLTTDWQVLVCLAVDTTKCYASHSIPKTNRKQRINRIVGLRQVLWNKDAFCHTLRLGTRGKTEFIDYTFSCWVVPQDYSEVEAYAKLHPQVSYILKPLTMGGGLGISVVDGPDGIRKNKRSHGHKKQIVQTYLGNPNLIRNRKWDMRTYVLVTSTYPVRAYFFQRGLVRFASTDYNAGAKRGGKKTQYLTNTSINKHNVKNGNVTELTWSFQDLKAHFDQESPGIYEKLISSMGAAISIVFLSAEHSWRRLYRKEMKYHPGDVTNCANCYQVMGVDLIVDANMHPRVIEVNGEPSMQLSKNVNDHYSTTKRLMLSEVAKVVFSGEDVVEEVADYVMRLPSKVSSALSEPMLEFISEFVRESKHLGGFRKVYPNHEYYELHSTFLQGHKLSADRVAAHHAANMIDLHLNEEAADDS